jgi:hypothetical protein
VENSSVPFFSVPFFSNKSKIKTVEGNTNGRGDRDSDSGDGVWEKQRMPILTKSYIRIFA